MACTIEGAGEKVWSVPEWVARNAVFFLIPHLQRQGSGQALAQRLNAILEHRQAIVVLSDLLRQNAPATAWLQAIERAERDIAEESAELWNEPRAYPAFCTAFAALRTLVTERDQASTSKSA